MTRTKIIILNGPPRSGKDTCATHLYVKHNARWIRMAQPLRNGLEMLTDVRFNDATKDEPNPRLFGKTYRQCMIGLSDWMKHMFGDDVLGKLATRQLANSMSQLHVFSDGGFVEEWQPVLRQVRPANMLLIKLHRDGCTFAGDSRSYITLPGVTKVDVYNNGTVEQLYKRLDDIMQVWHYAGEE